MQKLQIIKELIVDNLIKIKNPMDMVPIFMLNKNMNILVFFKMANNMVVVFYQKLVIMVIN